MERTPSRRLKRSELLLFVAPLLAFAVLMLIAKYREQREAKIDVLFRAELRKAQKKSTVRQSLLRQKAKVQSSKAIDERMRRAIEHEIDQRLLEVDKKLENEIRQRLGLPVLKPTPKPTPTAIPTPSPTPMFQLLIMPPYKTIPPHID
ncbi:MAG: hypothetical protein M3347_09140 [Armatimonadota bacterium]|nr:hypothetical protein [Armatimonadota bacterium]